MLVGSQCQCSAIDILLFSFEGWSRKCEVSGRFKVDVLRTSRRTFSDESHELEDENIENNISRRLLRRRVDQSSRRPAMAFPDRIREQHNSIAVTRLGPFSPRPYFSPEVLNPSTCSIASSLDRLFMIDIIESLRVHQVSKADKTFLLVPAIWYLTFRQTSHATNKPLLTKKHPVSPPRVTSLDPRLNTILRCNLSTP